MLSTESGVTSQVEAPVGRRWASESTRVAALQSYAMYAEAVVEVAAVAPVAAGPLQRSVMSTERNAIPSAGGAESVRDSLHSGVADGQR